MNSALQLGKFLLDWTVVRDDGVWMSEKPTEFNLNLTDDEFVALHAQASAEGLEVNDFIVATLRKHARIVREIEKEQEEKREGG